MGNAPINANVQKNTAKPLAITAVSLTLKLQKSKVLYLRDVLSSFADDDGCINYDHFKKGLKKAKFIKSREADVFDLLFTMWDSDGEDKILLKDLVVGIAPLACPEEGLGKILQFAMILSDQDKRGTIGHDELEDVLYSKLLHGVKSDRKIELIELYSII
jgi:Ca2+-binding EF-hand superfamily protein